MKVSSTVDSRLCFKNVHIILNLSFYPKIMLESFYGTYANSADPVRCSQFASREFH